jgi:hypothetical protein
MRWAGHVKRMGDKKNAYRILVGKPEGKRPLGRTRCMWVNIIKTDLREIGWIGMDWIDMAQGPVEGSCIFLKNKYGCFFSFLSEMCLVMTTLRLPLIFSVCLVQCGSIHPLPHTPSWRNA